MAVFTDVEAVFIGEQRVARLATSDGAGQPHVVPVCYAFDETHFYTPIDEKPKRVGVYHLKRVRNILDNPQVALIIDHYSDNWTELSWVLVRGSSAILEAGPQHAHGVALLRDKYPQYRSMALEDRPIIDITPVHVTSWGALHR